MSMTPEQRLIQMEKLLETTIKLTHKNTQKIDANNEAISNLTEKMDNLTDRVDTVTQQMGELTNIFIDSIGVIKEMQSQVRGLQIENRRIIERVFREDEL